MSLDIVQDIVSDILKGVEELLWPEKSLPEFILPTVVEEKSPVEPSREIRKEVVKEIPCGPLVDLCLQKYWFRISGGRQHLRVLCTEPISPSDIKEQNSEQISSNQPMINTAGGCSGSMC